MFSSNVKEQVISNYYAKMVIKAGDHSEKNGAWKKQNETKCRFLKTFRNGLIHLLQKEFVHDIIAKKCAKM